MPEYRTTAPAGLRRPAIKRATRAALVLQRASLHAGVNECRQTIAARPKSTARACACVAAAGTRCSNAPVTRGIARLRPAEVGVTLVGAWSAFSTYSSDATESAAAGAATQPVPCRRIAALRRGKIARVAARSSRCAETACAGVATQ